MKLLMSILEPFRRKKVGQWSLAYVAAAWVVIQVVDVLGGRWGITEEHARSLDIILVTGFFVVLTLAWYQEDKGHQKMRGRELLRTSFILPSADRISPRGRSRGRDAARRAVTLDPTDALAHYSLPVTRMAE